MKRENGTFRDSVAFSILVSEWPQVKPACWPASNPFLNNAANHCEQSGGPNADGHRRQRGRRLAVLPAPPCPRTCPEEVR